MRVVAAWGRRFALRPLDAVVEAPSVQARTRGKRLRPVTGDIVDAHALEQEDDWLITHIGQRDNELVRPDLRGRREILAANIDLMIIVACSSPQADFFIVDRYLAGARLMGIDAALAWNKSDLAPPPAEAAVLADLGYPVAEVSAKAALGLAPLQALMRGRRSIFVGQSGVGKSSLVNALAGEERQRTNVISGSKEGKHTTVAAEIIPLADGAEIIDSPGVRDFAPHIEDVGTVAQGFREIDTASAGCRFSNCLHRAEPDCAVKAAVDNGSIDKRRYQSYLRLAQLTRQLQEGRY